MKKLLTASIIATALLPATSAAEIIIGAKGGIQKVDVSGYSPAPMLSAQLSYEFLDLIAADLAVELEAGKTVADGKLKAGGSTEDFSVTTIGAYISARTTGPIYAIGRIGVARTELDYEAGDSIAETGLAVGAGAGFSLGARTELELTRYDIEDEQAFYLSLGMAF